MKGNKFKLYVNCAETITIDAQDKALKEWLTVNKHNHVFVVEHDPATGALVRTFNASLTDGGRLRTDR